jgi:hypothetical protein
MGPAAPIESSSAFAASRSLTLLQQMQVEGEGGGAMVQRAQRGWQVLKRSLISSFLEQMEQKRNSYQS